MSTETITCIASFTAKTDQIENLKNALIALLEPTRSEPGCVSYVLHQSIDNLAKLTMIEMFKDQLAFDFHSSQTYLKNLVNRLDTLVESVDIQTFRTVA